MRQFKLSIALVAAIALSACAFERGNTPVDGINDVQAVGSPFTQHLTDEYRTYANMESTEGDYPDSLHYARKGLASAEGEAVLPEPISDWNLRPEHIEELRPSRARLISALNRGGREVAPQIAAVAQARFDCWIEEQEEAWESVPICKSQFMQAMSDLEARVGAQPPVEDVMMPVTDIDMGPSGPMAVEDAKYLVFFDFDKSNIEQSAANVLDVVAQEAANQTLNSVMVVGHTDTSGSNSYNQALAMRRANSARDALIQRGVPAELIQVESRGESELMVPTPDGVREPANRRVEVSFN